VTVDRVWVGGQWCSRLGFGGAAIGGHDYGLVDDAESIAAIHAALDHGITLFDVADVYGLGHAESVLGRALSAAGSRRHDVLIATKVGVRWDAGGAHGRDLSPQWIGRAVDASLSRLSVDRIGLLQVHWPDGEVIRADTIAALRRCQEQGKAVAIGCCNLAVSMLPSSDVQLFSTLQLPFSLVERQHGAALLEARDAAMTTMAYNVLGRGMLTGKFGATPTFSGSDTRAQSHLLRGDWRTRVDGAVARLHQVAAAHGRTLAQVAIRWALDRREVDIALAGAKTAQQVADNADALTFTLSHDERVWLDDAIDEQSPAHPNP
jgi:aryl-alcohol dehydrogenase-like predicted oxidoreductase